MRRAVSLPHLTPPRGSFFPSVFDFVRRNTVLCIAVLLAIVTACLVPPDRAYLGYFDFKTLSCLFCTLAVICALKNIRFFTIIAERIVRLAGNLRSAVLLLVYITFVGSMLLANDMALLTFLPLGFFVLSSTKMEKYMAFTFIMQNISANLGGMVTPFGNPQNLYLYTKFSIPTKEFVSIMLLPFVVSMVLFTVCCLFLPKLPLQITGRREDSLPKARTAIYLILFALSIIAVFRVISYILILIVVAVSVFLLDRKALARVDYGLLFTFVAFFVFAGNLARIPAVHSLLSDLLSRGTLLVSALSCQIMSNVPTAILLSEFTSNYRELLMGVNIGGVGTLVASLASLITLREYVAAHAGKTSHYLILFSVLNFSFLVILTAVCFLIV